MDEKRVEFEKWIKSPSCKSVLIDDKGLWKKDDGEYGWSLVATLFEAWQAAWDIAYNEGAGDGKGY